MIVIESSMHKIFEKCLGINHWVNKKQQKDPT